MPAYRINKIKNAKLINDISIFNFMRWFGVLSSIKMIYNNFQRYLFCYVYLKWKILLTLLEVKTQKSMALITSDSRWKCLILFSWLIFATDLQIVLTLIPLMNKAALVKKLEKRINWANERSFLNGRSIIFTFNDVHPLCLFKRNDFVW